MIAFIGIVLFAPLLARWALAFGPAEYFARMCFAFACLTGLMGARPMKALLAALLGLALSTVGVDANSGVYRFTFDSVHLSDGIQFIVVVIGLFSVSEILLMLEHLSTKGGLIRQTGRALFNLREMALTWWGTVRSGILGFVVGVLPGAGATIASAMAYSMEKRLNGKDGTFGRGDIRGVTAPEAAGNGSACGSFVPMLTLGVPGDLLRKCDVPMAPPILGFVLGDLMEQNLRRALSISNGELYILWPSPITIALWILAALMVTVPLFLRGRRRERAAAAVSGVRAGPRWRCPSLPERGVSRGFEGSGPQAVRAAAHRWWSQPSEEHQTD